MAQDYWSPTAAETVNRLSSAMTQLEHSMNYQFSGRLHNQTPLSLFHTITYPFLNHDC